MNKEDRIEDELKSCAGIADEIVVVDSYSTDRTIEIAQKYGATFDYNGPVKLDNELSLSITKIFT